MVWVLFIVVFILLWLGIAIWELAQQDIAYAEMTRWHTIAKWLGSRVNLVQRQPFYILIIKTIGRVMQQLRVITSSIKEYPLVSSVVNRLQRQPQVVAAIRFVQDNLLIVSIVSVGLLIAVYGHNSKNNGGSLTEFAKDFYEGYFAEIVGIAITVFVIDRMNRVRDKKRDDTLQKESLIVLARSGDSNEAAKAIRLLEKRKWLKYADLTNTDLSDCNLSNLDLRYLDFSDTNFTKANLSQSDLTDAILQNADLTSANLSETTLVGAGLSDANIYHAEFRGADISDATMNCKNIWRSNLRGSIYSDNTEWLDRFEDRYQKCKAFGPGSDLSNDSFRRCDLRGLDLRNANFSNTDLTNADFRGTKLQQADLTGAKLEKTNFFSTTCAGVILEKATYDSETVWPDVLDYRNLGAFGPGTNFSGQDLSGQTLSGFELIGADFQNATLIKTKLYDTDLSDTDLRGANLHQAPMNKAILKGAKLANADLSEADLKGADLRQILDLDKAILNHAKYDEATQWPEGFDYRNSGAFGPESNLRSEDLQGIRMFDVDLRDADLRGADLGGASLSNINLCGADLSGANLNDMRANDIMSIQYDDNTTWPDDYDYEQFTKLGMLRKVHNK